MSGLRSVGLDCRAPAGAYYVMADASRCVVKTYDGISLRLWQASDIRNDERLMRIDILYGFAALRPEWACRITS